MSEWYNDLDYHDFDGKHVLVTLDDGTTISGAITYDTLALTAKKEDDTCSGYIRMNTTVPMITAAYTSQRYLAILVNMEDCRWRPLDGIKSVDLVWDEREYDKIPVDHVRTGDWIVLEGRKYLVTQIVGSTIVASNGRYMEVDRSMVSTVLRYRKGENHE
ncbi:MAG: hypothetical protein [Bacteriophage sp.]|nr:MAG: hypothetical protein [Bacteriophage sp.]